MPDLTGMTVVVTGAGGGIGIAATRRLVADGARVAALDLNLDAAQRSLEAARAESDQGVAIACDVGDETSLRDAVHTSIAALGPIGGVFAGAGIPSRGPLHETSLEDWERSLRVNLTGVFLTVKHCLPSMIAEGRGSIVTAGSLSSVIAASGGGGAAYKATKGGVNLLTKSIAVEYASYGIRANCLCPGAVDTGFAEAGGGRARGSAAPVVTTRAPLGRKAGPGEIAAVLSFLLSSEASFVTGATMMVDGGFTAS